MSAAIEVYFGGRYLGDYEFDTQEQARLELEKKEPLRALGFSYYLKQDEHDHANVFQR